MKKFILFILLIFLKHLPMKGMEDTLKGLYALNRACLVEESQRNNNEESNAYSLINNQQSSHLKVCFETINSYEKFLLKAENIWHTESLLNNMLYKVCSSLNVLMNVQERSALLDFTKNMLEKNGYLAFASIKNTFDMIMNNQLIQKSETNEHEVNPTCSQLADDAGMFEHSLLINVGGGSTEIEKHEHFLNAMYEDDEQKRLQGIEKILMRIDTASNLLSKDISSLNKNFILEAMIDDMTELTNYLYQFDHYKYSSTKLIDKMVEDFKNDGYTYLFPNLQSKLQTLIQLKKIYTPDAITKPNKLLELYANYSSCNELAAQSNKQETFEPQFHTFIDSNPVHLNSVGSFDQQESSLPKVEKEDHEMNKSLSLGKFGWQNECSSFCVCKKFRGKKYRGLVTHCYESHSKKTNDVVYYNCPSDQCKGSTFKRRTFIVHLIEVHKLFNIKGTKLVKFISAKNAFESIKRTECANKTRSKAKLISQVPIKSKKNKKVKKTVLRKNALIISDEKPVPKKDETSVSEPTRYIECDTHRENSNDFWDCFDEFFKVEKDLQTESAI